MAKITSIKLLALTLMAASVIPIASEPAMADGYSVRVTTGSYRISGWENSLIQGDRSLRHWHWSPMVGFRQGVRQVSPRPARSPGTLLYTKPVRVPTNAAPNRVYQKPIQVPAGYFAQAVNPSRNVHAEVMLPAAPPSVAVYPKLEVASAQGKLSSYEVHGKVRK